MATAITMGRPHVWLSPPNLSRMAEIMAKAMSDADPDHAAIYRENLKQTVATLQQLHHELSLELAPFRGTSFYVFHPSFGYFAKEYGLRQAAVEVSGKSPTPKQLSALIARARQDRVRIIFVQPQFDSRSAAAVARAIDGVVEPRRPPRRGCRRQPPDHGGPDRQPHSAMTARPGHERRDRRHRDPGPVLRLRRYPDPLQRPPRYLAGRLDLHRRPNGAGKTTLIKLILGLLSPDRGTIRVFGQRPEAARQRIGYVPQYAKYDPQFPISVLDVVLMGRLGGTLRNSYSPQDRDRAMAALGQTGLTDLAVRPFASISGGQRQRTLIARALASGGDILILDEPTANIDHESELQFLDLLRGSTSG